MGNILVTGACGQLGVELVNRLREMFGAGQVIATDIREPESHVLQNGPFELLDVMDADRLRELLTEYKVETVYHLAALLSAKAEENIELARKLNVRSLILMLDAARDGYLTKLFWPSSIAVFGPDADANLTPQGSACNPTTVYGINKMTGEQWCAYYHRRFGVDVRSLRYPGLIGYKSMPGGGTTDYAVEIYHRAVKKEAFSCFLRHDACLPMMYMNDAIKATISIMQADPERLSVRTSYNLAAMSYTPEEAVASIRRYFPEFEADYAPDYRQDIASSWPNSIDDSPARYDWGWHHDYNLDKMTDDILANIVAYWNYEEYKQ